MHKKTNKHVLEIILVLVIFLLVSLGNAFSKTDVKTFFTQEYAAMNVNINNQ